MNICVCQIKYQIMHVEINKRVTYDEHTLKKKPKKNK